MSAEVVAIRHVHFEDLGSFEQVLGERGRRVRYVDVGSSRFEVLDALQPSLFVVLGGLGPVKMGQLTIMRHGEYAHIHQLHCGMRCPLARQRALGIDDAVAIACP